MPGVRIGVGFSIGMMRRSFTSISAWREMIAPTSMRRTSASADAIGFDLHNDDRLRTDRTKPSVQQLARGRVVGRQHQVLSVQLHHPDALALRQRMRRRYHERHFIVAQRLERNRHSIVRPIGDADVEIAGFDAAADRLGVLLLHGDTDRRMLAEKNVDAGRQQADVERVGHANAQAAAQLLGRAANAPQSFVDLRQRELHLAEQLLAGFGDHNPLADAVEQPVTDFGLELLDLVRQRRLGDVNGLGRTGES